MHPTNGNYPDRAETGRARALKSYVEPELEVLFLVARTLTGSSVDAEDLVQETLIRASVPSTGSTGSTHGPGC